MGIFTELLTYFLVYSFLGWIVESIYKSIYEKKFINSGFLYGPFCPIYGCGAIIMYIFLDDVSSKPFITFCLGFVVLSIWEYIVGVFLEKVFHRKYWDYSNCKYNLQGRICLKNSIFWGILGVLFIDIIHPILTGVLASIDDKNIINLDILVSIIMLIDMIISINSNFSIVEKLRNVEELNEIIKEKLEEIKEKGKNIELKTSIQNTLEELNLRREILIKKAYRTIIRLRKAFPSMNSEDFNEFLNDKKDSINKNNK